MMKTQRLQAAYARRREADSERIQKSSAVNKYFDHWNKVNTRFETWTTPEYYQHAEEALREEKTKKLKQEKLEERRNKIRQLLDGENARYKEELRDLDKPRPRKLPIDLLEKINRDQKYLSEEKTRLDLESKLYGKWRYGIMDESLLFESKTNNEALAKLNWLDKQIENRMIREDEEKKAEERQLKLLEETRKREENQKELQKICEAEIKELRAIQESSMAELKLREQQTLRLHERESSLIKNIEKLENELQVLELRKNLRPEVSIPHNAKRLKMLIRQRSEQVRKELQDDIDVLKRIYDICRLEDIENLKNRYIKCYNSEVKKASAIESMYESEAKQYLIKSEEEWKVLVEDRQVQVSGAVKKVKNNLETELSENLAEQKRLVETQQTLLTSIENANEKLKDVVREQENYIQANDLADAASSEMRGASGRSVASGATSRSGETVDSPRRPQFGRKKVAWT